MRSPSQTTAPPGGALTPLPDVDNALVQSTSAAGGPPLCPACGTLVPGARPAFDGVASLFLTLLAGVCAVVAVLALGFAVVLLSLNGGPLQEALLSVVVGLGSAFAAVTATRSAQIPERLAPARRAASSALRRSRRDTSCAGCGHDLAAWSSPQSARSAELAALVAGPLLVVGQLLLLLAIQGFLTERWTRTLGEVLLGVFALVLGIAVARRPWIYRSGNDLAFASTLGRLSLGGEGVSTSALGRSVASAPPDLSSPAPAAIRKAIDSLAAKRAIQLEAHDDLLWHRVLVFHRLRRHTGTLVIVRDPSAPGAPPEGELETRILEELDTRARQALPEGADYRTEAPVAGAVRVEWTAELFGRGEES